MSIFEKYTLVVFETPEEYFSEIPEHRFSAHLKEIPEASLHEFGASQEEAIRNLRDRFGELEKEMQAAGTTLPPPSSNEMEEYSGRLVLRMPKHLHRVTAMRAEEQGVSLNSYIVHQLIRGSSMEEVCEYFVQRERQVLGGESYTIGDWLITSSVRRKGVSIADMPQKANVYDLRKAG
jgi:antitoxin HicB